MMFISVEEMSPCCTPVAVTVSARREDWTADQGKVYTGERASQEPTEPRTMVI